VPVVSRGTPAQITRPQAVQACAICWVEGPGRNVFLARTARVGWAAGRLLFHRLRDVPMLGDLPMMTQRQASDGSNLGICGVGLKSRDTLRSKGKRLAEPKGRELERMQAAQVRAYLYSDPFFLTLSGALRSPAAYVSARLVGSLDWSWRSLRRLAGDVM
jgi:hypothetical protein